MSQSQRPRHHSKVKAKRLFCSERTAFIDRSAATPQRYSVYATIAPP